MISKKDKRKLRPEPKKKLKEVKRFSGLKPIYIGKRKLLPDVFGAMTQETNIIVLLAGQGVDGMTPMDWVDEHIHTPLRPRTEREIKSGRFK